MKLSVQIYSLRAAGDFETQLALAHEAGFEWIESVADHGLAAPAFADALARHGLKLSSMHASLDLLETDPGRIVDACKATGCKLVVMPWLPRGEISSTGAGWTAMGRRLAALGKTLATQGLRLAYHNHDFEFLAFDGRTALEWLFDAAPAAQLGWEADLGWVRRAGQDPLLWTRRYADRLDAVHVKDIAADAPHRKEDGWCTLGQGIVGWETLLPALRGKTELFVYEHDNPGEYRQGFKASLQLMQRGLG
jgi:sugar phosphate isomerase/epimerase